MAGSKVDVSAFLYRRQRIDWSCCDPALISLYYSGMVFVLHGFAPFCKAKYIGLRRPLSVGVLYTSCSRTCSTIPFRRAPPLPLPQLHEAATEPKLYTFVMRSYRMVQQTVYGAAYSARAIAGGHSPSDIERGDEGEEVDPRLFGASPEVLDTMIERLKEYSSQFGRLGEAVDR